MGGRDESYLEFVEYDHGKQITKRFRVKHSDYADSREVQHEGEDIGDVKWYPPWRRYAFFPSDDTLYDSNCLRELLAFIESLMAERELKEG